MQGAIVLTLTLVAAAIYAESPREWDDIGRDELRAALRIKLMKSKPKNIVVFIGDGMGLSTVTAARILKGQLAGKGGERGFLSWEHFAHTGILKTYSDNYQVPDSGAATTAMFSGQKTSNSVLGLNSQAQYGNCSTQPGNEITTALQWAQEAGKATGLVTNTRITHATPGALYAKTVNRNWEGDSDIPAGVDPNVCTDIAKQLIFEDPGNDLNVILGGGLARFLPQGLIDVPTGTIGKRKDYLNLINEWQNIKAQDYVQATFVRTKDELNRVDADSITDLLGLFGPDHLEYELFREQNAPSQPSLSDMTKKAIQILKKHENGFFLVVEGGKIDLAHHVNRGKVALHEVVEFDIAIQAALDMLPEDETLILVTSDHAQMDTISGYAVRGNPILDFGNPANIALPTTAENIPSSDGLPYTTLMYTNGPSAINSFPRRNLAGVDTEADSFTQDALVPLINSTHAGQDVIVYASGPWSHLFTSVREQNFVAHALDYAGCYRYKSAPHCYDYDDRKGYKAHRRSKYNGRQRDSEYDNMYGRSLDSDSPSKETTVTPIVSST